MPREVHTGVSHFSTTVRTGPFMMEKSNSSPGQILITIFFWWTWERNLFLVNRVGKSNEKVSLDERDKVHIQE